MPWPRKKTLARVGVTALLGLLLVSGLVAGGLWYTARGRPVEYDAKGKPRRLWNRLARGTPAFNVVVIAVDTLRADALGAYASDRNAPSATPRIDALAAQSVVFDGAMTAAIWTLPSFASIFTGLYPPAHGTLDKAHALDEHNVTLAEILRQAGCDTAAFTAGGFLTKNYDLDQGFRTFEYKSKTRMLGESVDGALHWLDTRKRKAPFLLFLHGFDMHRPYRPDPLPDPPRGYVPPPLDAALELAAKIAAGARFGDFPLGLLRIAVETADLRKVADFDDHFWKWISDTYPTRESFHLAWKESPGADLEIAWVRALYRQQVRTVDDAVGRLLDGLDARGVLQDSMIVFLADHGEELMEHAMIGHTRASFAVCRVPLLIRAPRAKAWAPRRVPDVVRLIDVMPTILDAMDLPAPEQVQGRSLLPFARGERLPPLAAASFGTRHPEDAVRFQNYFLIHRALTENDPIAAQRLFDVDADPTESVSLASTDPRHVELLEHMLDVIHSESLALSGSQRLATGTENDASLRELGYMGGE